MTIWKFLYSVLKKTNVMPAIVAAVIFIIGLAYMLFLQSLLMQSNLDLYSNMVSLICYSITERFLKAVNQLVVSYFIMKPFKIEAEKSLVETFITLSPSSLMLMKDDAYALKSAALRALEALVENGLNIIIPIMLMISRSAALSATLDNMQLFIVLACLSCMFLVGLAILAYDHYIREMLSKIETEVAEEGRSLMTSLATIVVNGLGKTLPIWITNLKKKQSIPSTKHDVIMTIMYGSLEIATTSIPIALVWVLKGDDLFLPLYVIIQPMFWSSWYLFSNTKSLIVSTAPWTQYAEFMKNVSPLPGNLVKPDSPKSMMSIFGTEIEEVELYGPSGCGKTTLMRKIISDICSKYKLGYIIYIEQFACLPLCQQIIEYYASSFPEGKIPVNFEYELIRRAVQLGISNIINEETLKKSFSKPSGGEKKRIIFLKYILPILLGSSKVMIVFLDEVSAGLDIDSFLKVRTIIEEIKRKGVKVVSIDHHDHVGRNILKAQVFKRVYQIYSKKKPKVLSFWQKMIVKLFPRIYIKKEEEEIDLEQCDEQDEIDVWAPAIGIEDPQ